MWEVVEEKVLTEEPVNVPLLAQNLLDICITGTSVHSNKDHLEAAAKSLASLMNKVGTQNDKIIETCTTFLVDAIKDTSSQTPHIYIVVVYQGTYYAWTHQSK